MSIRTFLTVIFTIFIGLPQALGENLSIFNTPKTRSEIYNFIPPHQLNPDNPEDMLLLLSGDTITAQDTTDITRILTFENIEVTNPIPDYYFRPAVFDRFHLLDSIRLPKKGDKAAVSINDSIYGWLVTDALHNNLLRRARQSFFVNYPQHARYDEAHLPEPPRKFEASVDPKTAKIVIAEVIPTKAPEKQLEARFGRRHWLKTFNGSVQFSQAYISPNWYKGGNKNMNVLINAFYNVKLNPAFHKKLLFETTVQYKLGMNDAPDDSLRNYSISEDLFQFNMLAGYRASKRWYYSTNVMFKTQFLNNYKSNLPDLKSAFLSPGELNVGVGMTYNYANPKKTFTLDASISPFSWNMKTSINHRIDETSFGIKEGRKTVSEYGSNAEAKLSWKICDNISLRSRLFVFTDYEYAYGDWENTISFNINRFLSTQIFVHMRYDSSTPACDDPDWHKFQLKEILSFGFAYQFSTI